MSAIPLFRLRRLAVVGVCLLTACGPRPEPRSLEEIRASGVLRVIARPGFSDSKVHDESVDQRRLLRHLAGRLEVRLDLRQADRHDELLAAVQHGEADLSVGRWAPSELRNAGLVSSAAVDWVEDLLIHRPGVDGGPLELPPSRARTFRRLLSDDWTTRPVPEELPQEVVVARVASGRYRATLTDSVVTAAVLGSPERDRVTERPLGRRPLVWGMHPKAEDLKVAVDDFLFAEQVLLRADRQAACRDLGEIQEERVLRLITTNSPTTVTVHRGGLAGFEYRLVHELTSRLRIRLELVVPPPGEDPIRWLREGLGDIAALHEPPDPTLPGDVTASRPYRHVDLVTVAQRGLTPRSVESLAGLPVAASPRASAWLRQLPLEPPILPMGDIDDPLAALAMVRRGAASVAVVGSDLVRLELQADDDPLQVGTPVLPRLPLVWLFRSSSPALAEAVDAFLRDVSRSGLVRIVAAGELVPAQRRAPPGAVAVPEGSLTPWDELLKRVGRTHEIDWRLLASLMYQESRFDPRAVGPGGSAGLFQFMPMTWQELGVEDPFDPEEAADAAATYLRQQLDRFDDLALVDQVAMAVASYNVGPRHVYDARRQARRMGLDPTLWHGNVETALLVMENPEVARTLPAGVCRCRRAVRYTRDILRRYLAYAEQFPPT